MSGVHEICQVGQIAFQVKVCLIIHDCMYMLNTHVYITSYLLMLIITELQE